MLNKNISIWRGTQTPPTNYHLWEKEDGGLYVYIDEKWQHLIAPNDKTILDEHLQQLNKIKDLAITEVTPTNTNTYKSYLLKSGDNIFGTTIDIPKDKFIKLVALGYGNATIDSSTGLIDIGTGVLKEYLLFSVVLESGKYELVSISLTSFLTERDYADGLEVIDNKIKVKIDPNSEEYIDVSIAGLKVKGINNKISSTVDDIKNKILNGEWLSLRAGRDTDNNIKLGAIAEGTGTTASGENSHAEGNFTIASGKNSHASGNSTNALGENSHAEGSNTHAKGVLSHTEGLSTKAIGNCSHALGALNYDDSSFIDMIGIGGNTSNSVIEKNAAVIYVGRDTTGLIDVNAAKNGYQYLIDVGGYQGQEIGDAKSVQEVFADINNVLYTLHARVTLTASPTIIEKGVSTAINLSWLYIYNDKVIIPTSMELKSNNNVLENIKHTYIDTINNTKTYLVTAINEGVTNTSNIITVNAYYPMYFGEGNNIFNQIEVITIANKRPIASSPKGDVSITFTGGKYLWLCIPSTMNITKVTSSGFTVPMEAPITLTIHESYKCYRSTDTINKGTVNFTINGASISESGNLQLSASLYKIVDTLPTTDIDTSKIYLVPASTTTTKNNKTEYIYLGDPNKAYDESKWEKLGDEQKSSTVTTPGDSITVDTALIENSPNPVAGGVVKAKIDEIDTKLAKKVESSDYTTKMTAIDSKLKTLENKTIDVDAELKDSPNPVQNRAVKKAVNDLNDVISKKADTTALNSAVGRITALENNGATGITVTESGEGNGIASIKNVGKNIVATKATFVTSLTGLATTAALNDGLAGKADVNHNHDTKYAAKEHTHPEYAQSSALNDYVTKTALDRKNFLTATSLAGYVNEVQPDGTQSGNGIANITKEGKVLKVTKATFLTEHQSLAGYATQTWVNNQGFAKGTIPTKTSQLNNDSGFLTQHQSLDGYVNNVNVTEVTNGNGIASIAKNGKDINVTQGAFLTAIDGIIAETGEAVAGKGVTDISIRGNKLVKKTGTFVTPATLGDAIDSYASNKGYLTENNLNEKLKETVTIKLVSDKSASDTNLNGATITVKSGDTTVSTQTWQGTPINVKVPCDKDVTIEAATVKMYAKPKALTYVPSPLYNREVVFTYKALELGVFIIDTNDKIYKTTNEFTQSGLPTSDAVGALLVTNNVAIVIQKGMSKMLEWSTVNQLVEGVTTTTNSETAVQDFKGKANTEAIVKAHGQNAPAAYYCSNYTFGNGKKGYLPSLGEMHEIELNMTKLMNILNNINTDSENVTNRKEFWTSTQKDEYRAWLHTSLNYKYNSKETNTLYAVSIYSLYD